MIKRPVLVTPNHFDAMKECIVSLRVAHACLEEESDEAVIGGSGQIFVKERAVIAKSLLNLASTKAFFDEIPLPTMSRLTIIKVKLLGKPILSDSGYIWAYLYRDDLYVLADPIPSH